jgi:hypothetical protein
MPTSRRLKIIYRKITLHPPEADAVSAAFAESRSAVETDFAALQGISNALDAGWEGNQKAMFMEELGIIRDRIINILIPSLRSLEKKYQDYMVEKTIQETVEE